MSPAGSSGVPNPQAGRWFARTNIEFTQCECFDKLVFVHLKLVTVSSFQRRECWSSAMAIGYAGPNQTNRNNRDNQVDEAPAAAAPDVQR